MQVGVTAMLIASKYEDIWAPEVRDFVYISDQAYTAEQILEMEKIMLNTLRFSLTVPTSLNFLNRFCKVGLPEDNKQAQQFATYLVELALVDYACLKYSYSMVAAAAVFSARLMSKMEPVLPPVRLLPACSPLAPPYAVSIAAPPSELCLLSIPVARPAGSIIIDT